MIGKVRRSLGLAYYRYELTTAIYMLEFWEKCLINSLVLLLLGLTMYASVNYTPAYVRECLVSAKTYLVDLGVSGNSPVVAWMAPPAKW
ncbi:hypothetical protein RI367_004402 [Sorochytrium milnesiophthora]